MKEDLKNLKIVWDGEPTEEEFEKMEQFEAEFEASFPGQTVELIGTRPKSRG